MWRLHYLLDQGEPGPPGAAGVDGVNGTNGRQGRPGDQVSCDASSRCHCDAPLLLMK